MNCATPSHLDVTVRLQVLSDVSSVINSYAVGSLRALATLALALGNSADADAFNATATAIAASVNKYMFANGTYTDGLGISHSAFQASIYPL